MTHPLELLAERCESASGADRDLDAFIWAAINGGYVEESYRGRSVWINDRGLVKHAVSLGDGIWRVRDLLGRAEQAPAFTASLDAAMTLVPEGWRIEKLSQHLIPALHTRIELQCWRDIVAAKAQTPALALTAACLRSRIGAGS